MKRQPTTGGRMRFSFAPGKSRSVRSRIALLLCLTVALQGCGGGESGSGTSSNGTSSNSSVVTYSTQNGKITQLSISNSKSGQSGSFNLLENSSGQTIFSDGNVATPSGNFSYLFDSAGFLRTMTDQTTGTEIRINYFTDHVEMLAFDNGGVNTNVLVVYAVGNTLIAGLAQPGMSYTVNNLTSQMDVTADVKKTLLNITGSTAPLLAKNQDRLPSFDLIPSAFAQSVPPDLSTQSDGTFISGYAGAIFASGALIVIGTIAAFKICGPFCGGVAAVALTTILAWGAHADTVHVVPGFNGVYTSSTDVGGVIHTENNRVLGNFVSVDHEFFTNTASFRWTGTLTRTSAVTATITGSGTINNAGVRSFTVQNASITLNPTNGGACMAWLANDPLFGPIGGTACRTP